ncbi:hypothetical protein [Candidatus Magnetominusculus dajiuhuensis]|uniref:hypothetical protein n=1 Tax=Candidatus Magnetominusculus dajiuhuensis TaxID=3137712 RepID=UPI003B4320A0
MKKLFGIKEPVAEAVHDNGVVVVVEDKAVCKDAARGEERADIGIARFEKAAGVIFRRLEKSIQILEAIEASVDAKVAHFERLLQMADAVSYTDCGQNRRYEVLALTGKGLGINEIANVLGIQHGEIELILNLNR